MIKALIVDDERDARFILNNLLERHFSEKIEVVGNASSIQEAAEKIKSILPDLVFLDIQMPNGSGFELLEQFQQRKFDVIFVTAFNKFAIKAFKFSAFDYLLKPIKVAELRASIERFEINQNSPLTQKEQHAAILKENFNKIERLTIPYTEGFHFANLSEIIRLEGDGNYTHFIFTSGKKITTTKNLGEYEELLNENGFFRIHQSTIVNLKHITNFLKRGGGSVVLSDGKEFSVSRYRKAGLLSKFS